LTIGIKRILKKALHKILPFIMYKNLIGANRPLLRLLGRYDDSHALLNVGAGETRYTAGIVNMDIFPGDAVDVQAAAEALPFEAESFDLVILQDVIEHVNNPEAVRSEVERVLKKKGRLYIQVPFVFPFHHSPGDNYRFTINGVPFFFSSFDLKEKGVCCGPTIALVNALASYFSIALSFNVEILRQALWLGIRLILTPLVFLDLLVARSRFAHYFCSEVYFIGEKP